MVSITYEHLQLCVISYEIAVFHHSRILHSRKGVKHFFLELLLTKPAFQVVVQENGAHNIVHSAAIFGGHFNYGSEARTYLP